jgi:hypothetical protein
VVVYVTVLLYSLLSVAVEMRLRWFEDLIMEGKRAIVPTELKCF